MTSNEINERIFIETPRLIIKTLNQANYDAYRLQQKDPYFTKYFRFKRCIN